MNLKRTLICQEFFRGADKVKSFFEQMKVCQNKPIYPPPSLLHGPGVYRWAPHELQGALIDKEK